MNFIQDNLAANKHNGESKSDAIMSKNQILGRPVLGTPSLPIIRPNRQSASSSNNTKTLSTIRRKPTLGSAAMKSGSSRLTASSQVVVALCEGRGQARGIVGIAAMDIKKPVLILCQISDTQTYTNTLTKVNILRPVEVLIPSSFVECTTPSRIVTLLKDQFPNLTVSSVTRSAFRSNRGLSYVTSLCAPEFKSVTLVIREKFYALASASALIKYIQKEQHIMYPTRSIKIEYQEPEDTAVIDIDSADRLELVSSCNHEERAINLLSMLDHCVTGVGKKMLRATILQPPCIDHVTQARLDCVQELLENAELRIKLKGVLVNLHNIECALMFGAMVPQSAAAVSDKQLNYTLQLKTLLTNIEPLRTELEGAYHPLFRRIHEQLVKAPYSWLLKKIHKVLTEEAHPATGHAGDLQRCFAIRTGLNGFLDIARRTYMEVIDDMRAYVQNLSDKYSLPLRIHHTLKRGFHVVLNLTGNIRNMEKSSLPSVFVKVEKNTTHFTMTTSEMTNFGVRLQTNCQEIESISNVIIFQLMANIRQCIGHLYKLCDDVALLDVLQSLATVSSTSGYIRPKFSTEHMEIIGARHPLLEYSSVQEPVPNNIVASDLDNLHIVTGPNMSGKSIYVRQIPLLQVLAQIGCYVPAQSATFRSCTHVYARISVEDLFHDNSSTTTSTFVREMTEVQYMLNTVDTGSRSLVILDELCHNTSVDEGVSIAIAICEQLLKTKAYIFIATHFLSMTKLAGMYYSVSNSHLETVETIRDTRICIKFTHRLIAGINDVETYGIKLSRICGGSDMVSNRAEEILYDLLPTHKTIQPSACPLNITYLKYRLYADLKLLQLQNKLSAEVERKRLDEHEKLTGEHYEIGQMLSDSKIPSRTSASCGSRTTKSSSTADTSDRQKSKPSTSVYDIARKKNKPGTFDKPITKTTDSKIVDSLIPLEADFLYCITADSPELDCADSEHSDPLGVTVKHRQPKNNVEREQDGPSGDKSLDYDLDSPMYSPNFNLYSDINSPPYETHTPDSEAPTDIMNSFEPQILSSKPSEIVNLDTNHFVPNVQSSNIFETKFPDSVLFDSKSPHSPPFEISWSALENFQSAPPLDPRRSSCKQPETISSVPENVFLFTPLLASGPYDNKGRGSFQYIEEAAEYRSEIRYESTDCYGSERRESVTVSTYYAVSNYCVTESGSFEHTVRQEETRYTSYQEYPSHFLGSWSTDTTNSTAQDRDRYLSYNVNPSTSGYQSNVFPNQQLSRTTVQHSNTDDMACPSTSGIQSEPQRMSKNQSTTRQDGTKSRVPRHTYQFNVCPNQQSSHKTIQHTNTDNIAYPSTSGIQAKYQCKPKENSTATDSLGMKKQKHTFKSSEKKTEKPFIFNPVLPPRKSVTFDFSAKNDPSSFIKYANTNTESVPPNPDFKIEYRIEPIQKPVNFLSFSSAKPKEKTCEINLKPSTLKKPVNSLETLPCTSKSQTPQTHRDISTEPFVPKRVGRNKSMKSQSHDCFHTLFDLFMADYEEEKKKIEEVLKDDDDEEYLRNFQQDHSKQDPTPAPVMQRPREGVLSAIMNPKKKSKRNSRSDKGIKNKLPFEHHKQPAKTRTKQVSSPLFKHEKKAAIQQLILPEAYVPSRRAKTAKFSPKTPCYLEEPSKEQYNEKSEEKLENASRQEINVPESTTLNKSTTKRRLSGSEILSVPPPKLVDYNDSVVSGIGLMKQSRHRLDEDIMSKLCTGRVSTKRIYDTAANTNEDRMKIELHTTEKLYSNKPYTGNESIFSVDSERQFAKHLVSTGVTSTPLPGKCNTKGKTKMTDEFRRTFTKQEREDMLLGSSGDSLSNDDLNIHYRSKVGDASPKKPTPTQRTCSRFDITLPTKTDFTSLRTSDVKQGNSRNKLQQQGRQSNKNEQIVVDETQLSAGSSQSLRSKSQTILRPPKLIFKQQDNNEKTKNKPEPSTLNQQEQNRKRKPRTKTETNVKLEKQLSKRNSKVAGKPRRMQVDDKFSEDLTYNKLQTQVMAPLRSKRQRDMDQFFDDVKRFRINMEAMTEQPDSEFANIQYCPSKKQLSNIECIAVGQRNTTGEMTVTMNTPKPVVSTTPSIDRIINKYMGKAGAQNYHNPGNTLNK